MQELFSFEPPIPFHLFLYDPPNSRTAQHWHSFYEIGYCYEGTGTFYIGDRAVSVGPGDLILFPPYEPHIARSDDGGACRFFFLYFGAKLFPEEDRSLLLSFRRNAFHAEKGFREQFPEFPPLREYFRALMDEYENRRSGYASMLRSKMLELCVRLLRMEETMHGSSDWTAMLGNLKQIKPALELVEERFAEAIGLEELGAALSLSESRARHLFKAAVGKGFKEYLAFVRIQRAKQLLSESDASVTDVYLSCGYQSSAPFYRTFKQLVGLSPLAYRASHLEGNSRF